MAWDFVVETALILRRMLKNEGLEPWPKLTGGKGLHLMAPLDRTIDHDRPHASIGYQAPAPELFVPTLAAWPAAQPRPVPPAMLPLVPPPILN